MPFPGGAGAPSTTEDTEARTQASAALTASQSAEQLAQDAENQVTEITSRLTNLNADQVDDTNTAHKFVDQSILDRISSDQAIINAVNNALNGDDWQQAGSSGGGSGGSGIDNTARTTANQATIDIAVLRDDFDNLDADDIPDDTTTHKFVTQDEKDKLEGIQEGAQVNRTGAELESALNDYFGNEDWQTGGIDQTARDAAAANTQALASFDPDDLDDTNTLNKFVTQAILNRINSDQAIVTAINNVLNGEDWQQGGTGGGGGTGTSLTADEEAFLDEVTKHGNIFNLSDNVYISDSNIELIIQDGSVPQSTFEYSLSPNNDGTTSVSVPLTGTGPGFTSSQTISSGVIRLSLKAETESNSGSLPTLESIVLTYGNINENVVFNFDISAIQLNENDDFVVTVELPEVNLSLADFTAPLSMTLNTRFTGVAYSGRIIISSIESVVEGPLRAEVISLIDTRLTALRTVLETVDTQLRNSIAENRTFTSQQIAELGPRISDLTSVNVDTPNIFVRFQNSTGTDAIPNVNTMTDVHTDHPVFTLTGATSIWIALAQGFTNYESVFLQDTSNGVLTPLNDVSVEGSRDGSFDGRAGVTFFIHRVRGLTDGRTYQVISRTINQVAEWQLEIDANENAIENLKARENRIPTNVVNLLENSTFTQEDNASVLPSIFNLALGTPNEQSIFNLPNTLISPTANTRRTLINNNSTVARRFRKLIYFNDTTTISAGKQSFIYSRSSLGSPPTPLVALVANGGLNAYVRVPAAAASTQNVTIYPSGQDGQSNANGNWISLQIREDEQNGPAYGSPLGREYIYINNIPTESVTLDISYRVSLNRTLQPARTRTITMVGTAATRTFQDTFTVGGEALTVTFQYTSNPRQISVSALYPNGDSIQESVFDRFQFRVSYNVQRSVPARPEGSRQVHLANYRRGTSGVIGLKESAANTLILVADGLEVDTGYAVTTLFGATYDGDITISNSNVDMYETDLSIISSLIADLERHANNPNVEYNELFRTVHTHLSVFDIPTGLIIRDRMGRAVRIGDETGNTNTISGVIVQDDGTEINPTAAGLNFTDGLTAIAQSNNSVNISVDVDDLDTTNTINKFVNQAILDLISTIEANAKDDQTGEEIINLITAELDDNGDWQTNIDRTARNAATANAASIASLDPDDLDDTSTVHKFVNGLQQSFLGEVTESNGKLYLSDDVFVSGDNLTEITIEDTNDSNILDNSTTISPSNTSVEYLSNMSGLTASEISDADLSGGTFNVVLSINPSFSRIDDLSLTTIDFRFANSSDPNSPLVLSSQIPSRAGPTTERYINITLPNRDYSNINFTSFDVIYNYTLPPGDDLNVRFIIHSFRIVIIPELREEAIDLMREIIPELTQPVVTVVNDEDVSSNNTLTIPNVNADIVELNLTNATISRIDVDNVPIGKQYLFRSSGLLSNRMTTLEDFTDRGIASSVVLNLTNDEDIIITGHNNIILFWDGTSWDEISRNTTANSNPNVKQSQDVTIDSNAIDVTSNASVYYVTPTATQLQLLTLNGGINGQHIRLINSSSDRNVIIRTRSSNADGEFTGNILLHTHFTVLDATLAQDESILLRRHDEADGTIVWHEIDRSDVSHVVQPWAQIGYDGNSRINSNLIERRDPVTDLTITSTTTTSIINISREQAQTYTLLHVYFRSTADSSGRGDYTCFVLKAPRDIIQHHQNASSTSTVTFTAYDSNSQFEAHRITTTNIIINDAYLT